VRSTKYLTREYRVRPTVVFVGLPESVMERTVVIRGTSLGGLLFASLKSFLNLRSRESVYLPVTMPESMAARLVARFLALGALGQPSARYGHCEPHPIGDICENGTDASQSVGGVPQRD